MLPGSVHRLGSYEDVLKKDVICVDRYKDQSRFYQIHCDSVPFGNSLELQCGPVLDASVVSAGCQCGQCWMPVWSSAGCQCGPVLDASVVSAGCQCGQCWMPVQEHLSRSVQCLSSGCTHDVGYTKVQT